MILCNIVLYSIGLYLNHQSHPHWVLFLLQLSLFILSWDIYPLLFGSMLGTYWLGQFIFQCLFFFFCLFILFMGFPLQEYWSRLPFPFPVEHVLSQLSTMTHLSWLALHGMVHSFIELDKAAIHMIRLVSFLWSIFSFCLPSDKVCKASWWKGLVAGESGS